MRHAYIWGQGNCKLNVIHLGEDGKEFIEQSLTFGSEAEAVAKLRIAGWEDQGGGAWKEPVRRYEPFIGVPASGQLSLVDNGYVESFEFLKDGEKLRLRLVLNEFEQWVWAFRFRVESMDKRIKSYKLYDFDPVLSLCSHSMCRIEAVGCWYTTADAVEMAEFFLRRLEQQYGKELFSEALHAHVLRGLDRASAWFIGVDTVQS
jgi:hypothetical protein